MRASGRVIINVKNGTKKDLIIAGNFLFKNLKIFAATKTIKIIGMTELAYPAPGRITGIPKNSVKHLLQKLFQQKVYIVVLQKIMRQWQDMLNTHPM